MSERTNKRPRKRPINIMFSGTSVNENCLAVLVDVISTQPTPRSDVAQHQADNSTSCSDVTSCDASCDASDVTPCDAQHRHRSGIKSFLCLTPKNGMPCDMCKSKILQHMSSVKHAFGMFAHIHPFGTLANPSKHATKIHLSVLLEGCGFRDLGRAEQLLGKSFYTSVADVTMMVAELSYNPELESLYVSAMVCPQATVLSAHMNAALYIAMRLNDSLDIILN